MHTSEDLTERLLALRIEQRRLAFNALLDASQEGLRSLLEGRRGEATGPTYAALVARMGGADLDADEPPPDFAASLEDDEAAGDSPEDGDDDLVALCATDAERALVRLAAKLDLALLGEIKDPAMCTQLAELANGTAQLLAGTDTDTRRLDRAMATLGLAKRKKKKGRR